MAYTRSAALAAALFAAAIPTQAQNYPVKNVRYIVPMSPGSGADTIARIVAAGLTETFKQQVNVDNRAGAAGNIGAELAARAAPDGYTLFQASMSHAVNATLYKNLPYDLVRDFAPVTQLATAPSLVVVHPSLPVRTIGELVALAKKRPGQINYASAGTGTATFLAAEMWLSMAKIKLVHVPYRAGGEAVTSVMAGETQVYFAPLAAALSYAQQGRLRALAISSPKRLGILPDLPTVAETGYPGYASGNWYGIVLPAKAPRELVDTVHKAALNALNQPATNKRLVDLGYIIIADTPDQFAGHIKSEIAALAKVIEQTGIKAE